MTPYLIGNLLGRLAVSYLLVWGALFVTGRFDARTAFARSRRWYGLLAVAVVFTLGVAGALNRGGLT